MKKLLCIGLIISILMLFSSCRVQGRPDCEVLSDRMGEINKQYAFDYFDSFIYNDAYQIYYSLCSENDILMSIVTDGNGFIDRITVTAYAKSMSTNGEREAFRDFSETAAVSFTQFGDSEMNKLKSDMSFDNSDLYFSDMYEKQTMGRYNFIFSSNEAFIFFDCEYFEIAEDPTPAA